MQLNGSRDQCNSVESESLSWLVKCVQHLNRRLDCGAEKAQIGKLN